MISFADMCPGFFVEQETQLYVNIRLTGSGGSTWVTMKLAATWKYRFMIMYDYVTYISIMLYDHVLLMVIVVQVISQE